MNRDTFRVVLVCLAIGFAVVFTVLVVPPLLASGDVLGAFAAGFVNPYSSGYALDAITSWLVLAAWVIHESHSRHVRHGWVALLLGVVPGVATGFAVYLLLRMRRERQEAAI
jgi:hypothetical protein